MKKRPGDSLQKSANTDAGEMKPISVSIVIPAYNEASRILPTIRTIHRFFRTTGYKFEIIVVDDGSIDSTGTLVRDETTTLPHINLITNYPNQGKGAAVQKGIDQAIYDLILITDADLSTPIQCFDKLLEPLTSKGCDIAIGSRALPESIIPLHQSLHRRAMGRIFNLMVRCIVMKDFKDTQCGFKLFKAEAAKTAFKHMTTPGFAFDVEILFIAKKLGYRTAEIPVQWSNSPASKVRLLRDSISMFIDLIRIRTSHRKLKTPPTEATCKELSNSQTT